jgi:hypothetical protein
MIWKEAVVEELRYYPGIPWRYWGKAREKYQPGQPSE